MPTITVRNLTNSPFDLTTNDGRTVRLPAFGRVTGRFSDEYTHLLRASQAVEFIDQFEPLDHDRDGKKGGSLPSTERGVDEIRAEAESLGITVDKRWGAKRLEAEIASRSKG